MDWCPFCSSRTGSRAARSCSFENSTPPGPCARGKTPRAGLRQRTKSGRRRCSAVPRIFTFSIVFRAGKRDRPFFVGQSAGRPGCLAKRDRSFLPPRAITDGRTGRRTCQELQCVVRASRLVGRAPCRGPWHRGHLRGFGMAEPLPEVMNGGQKVYERETTPVLPARSTPVTDRATELPLSGAGKVEK